MSRTVHILQNSEFEPPGFISDWARKRKFQTRVVQAYAGEAYPVVDDVEMLVVLGAPLNVTDSFDWLNNQREWLKTAIAQETLILGLCFGAQLLAHILGGKVFASGNPEIGWHEIKFASSSLADTAVTLFQWHGDEFGLPPGARPLAKSKAVAVHGFQKGSVSALISHLEATPELVETFIAQFGDGKMKGPFVQKPDEIRKDLKARCEASNKFSHDFLDLWSESTFPAETPLKIVYR